MDEETKEHNEVRKDSWAEYFNNNNAKMFVSIGAKDNGEMIICGDESVSSLTLAKILEEIAKSIRERNKHVN